MGIGVTTSRKVARKGVGSSPAKTSPAFCGWVFAPPLGTSVIPRTTGAASIALAKSWSLVAVFAKDLESSFCAFLLGIEARTFSKLSLSGSAKRTSMAIEAAPSFVSLPTKLGPFVARPWPLAQELETFLVDGDDSDWGVAVIDARREALEAIEDKIAHVFEEGRLDQTPGKDDQRRQHRGEQENQAPSLHPRIRSDDFIGCSPRASQAS